MSAVLVERAEYIGVITMNRPEKRNALNPELVQDLHLAIKEVAADDAVRVVVLRGAGPAFCAGADLAYLQSIANNGAMENLADSTRLMELMRDIADLPKPVIAMVHGAAIAGGCGLATVCDVVVAAESAARFGYSEVGIGFIPAIVMVFLLRKVGDMQARRLVLTAEVVSAAEAVRIGLATLMVADDELEARTMDLARRMAGFSGSALALSKSMLSALHGMSLDAGLRYAAAMNALARQTEDCQAGIQQFLTQQRS
jgi:methylglutaconyl-CoA hydratase